MLIQEPSDDCLTQVKTVKGCYTVLILALERREAIAQAYEVDFATSHFPNIRKL